MKAVLAGKVQWRADGRRVPRDAADEHDTALLATLRPVRDGQLAQADGVREVDVQDGVVARVGLRGVAAHGVRVRGRPGRLPEGGPLGLEEACARDDDVHGGEYGEGLGPEGGELRPGGDVGLVEDGEGFSV